MVIFMNILDIFINISLLVFFHIIFYKLENVTSTKKIAVFFKSLARIFHNPLLIYFSIYIIAHKDNILISLLGTDILYYIIKIKMFSKSICLILIILNFIQIIYEIILRKRNDIKKDDKIYALGTIMGIIKIILIIILIIVVLSIFEIKPTSLLLTIGTPLTLLSILLKTTIEDILFGIYLRISQIYKRGEHIYLPEKNIEGYITNFGLRLIEIKTLDNNVIYLRNFTFLDNLVINKSYINNCRIDFVIEVKYQDVDDMKNIIDEFKEKITKLYSSKITYNLQELKVNLFKGDFFLEINIGERGKEQFASIKLEIVKILLEIIKKNNSTLERLSSTIK